MSQISKQTAPHVDNATFKARLWPSLRQATPLSFVWAVFVTALRAPVFLLLAPPEPTPIGLSPVGALLATSVMSYIVAIAALATKAAIYREGTFKPTAHGVANLVRNNWRPFAIVNGIAVPVLGTVWFLGMQTLHEAVFFFIGSVELLIATMLASLQPTAKEDTNTDQGVAAID